ncbi:hypothetical protein N183_28105 [Sinorhizobium sp. Sb3]|nr:hypothetical protein [Sinorhizobium sp. Sb3]KSV71051.1 hypothetical protein N183_28105 [Sinorhizobium sp. Sb3]
MLAVGAGIGFRATDPHKNASWTCYTIRNASDEFISTRGVYQTFDDNVLS